MSIPFDDEIPVGTGLRRTTSLIRNAAETILAQFATLEREDNPSRYTEIYQDQTMRIARCIESGNNESVAFHGSLSIMVKKDSEEPDFDLVFDYDIAKRYCLVNKSGSWTKRLDFLKEKAEIFRRNEERLARQYLAREEHAWQRGCTEYEEEC